MVLDCGAVHVIDFRYYLVSIVSIFLALAVGIVLGAGPLKGDIGTRLTEQMTALRAEKAQLRTDLDVARRGASARDTFATAVGPAVVRGRLAGKTIAIVVAPGVDADLVKSATASVVAAGARVGSVVTLTDAWSEGAKAHFGITVPGFPNLFCLYGPNTNIVINGSIIYFSECGVRYILGCLGLLLEGHHRALDVRKDVHDAFNEHVDAENRMMAWGWSDVNSWYKNEHGHVAQNWPFTLLEYWQRTLEPDPAEYELLG